MAVERGAHVIRTHDVAETRDAALIGDEFARKRTVEASPPRVEELDVTTRGEVARHVEEADVAVDPAAGVARAFSVAGLSEAAATELVDNAAGNGAGFAAVGDDGVLVGTDAALAALSRSLIGRAGELGTLGESLRQAIG
jgi:dihydropteroate synthase